MGRVKHDEIRGVEATSTRGPSSVIKIEVGDTAELYGTVLGSILISTIQTRQKDVGVPGSQQKRWVKDAEKPLGR